MSFHYVPGQFRIPKTPLFAMPDGIWCGADADSGVFAFEAGYSWGGRIMSRELCFSLSIDGSVMKPVFSSINGYIYWSGSGYVYYTQTYGWVYMSGMFPGYEPLEDYDSKDGERTWTGDRFYTFYSFPQQSGSAATLTPRGAIHDSGQEKELAANVDILKGQLPTGVNAGGHGGSHAYLTDDFLRGILVPGHKVCVDLKTSLNTTIAGVYAHVSAERGGETLKIPAS